MVELQVGWGGVGLLDKPCYIFFSSAGFLTLLDIARVWIEVISSHTLPYHTIPDHTNCINSKTRAMWGIST
jgi:hypothetical protein